MSNTGLFGIKYLQNLHKTKCKMAKWFYYFAILPFCNLPGGIDRTTIAILMYINKRYGKVLLICNSTSYKNTDLLSKYSLSFKTIHFVPQNFNNTLF